MVIINKCIEEDLNIYPIPGPSAVTAAMSISGFEGKFLFYGFLTKKENELDKILKNISKLDYSLKTFVIKEKFLILIIQ